MSAILVYITATDASEARSIGRALVEDRLAACVNIVDDVTSIYRWEQSLQEDNEAIVIAKSTRDKLPALIERVKELHSYEIPCIVALPIDGGNNAFLRWMRKETH